MGPATITTKYMTPTPNTTKCMVPDQNNQRDATYKKTIENILFSLNVVLSIWAKYA